MPHYYDYAVPCLPARAEAGYILGMAKIVVKFGGSNLKTSADLHRSAEVAKAYHSPLIIVVSAFSGVTDSLARALEEAVVSLDSVSVFLNKLEASHREALRDHVGDARELAIVDAELSGTLNLLDRLLKGVLWGTLVRPGCRRCPARGWHECPGSES